MSQEINSEKPKSNYLVPKAAVWVIFFVVFIDILGFGIVFPLLPEYMRTMHLTGYQCGLVVGIYSLMQFLFAPMLGQWSDKIGRRPILILSMAGTALSFIVMAYARSFELFLIARALDGIAGSSIATAQAYIADISPKENRTKNMGMWIGAAFGLGFAFGPCLGGVFQWLGDLYVPSFGPGFALFIAGLMCIANMLFAFLKLPESRKLVQDTHQIGSRTNSLWSLVQTLKRPAVGQLILAYALVIFGFAFMEATMTWLAKDFYHLDKFGIYGLFAFFGFVICYGQGKLVRKLSDSWGDQKLALVGIVILGVTLALLPLYPGLLFLIVVSGLMCLGESLCQPSLLASISKLSGDNIQGETMGVTQSFASLARFAGPALAGLMYAYGPVLPYMTAAALMLPALALVYIAFNKQKQLINI